MISICLKNYFRKQENEHFIPMKGLQKEQLSIPEKGINVLCTKQTKTYWLRTGQGYYISLDPLRDAKCQLSSICRILRECDLQRSPEELRAEIVSYLKANPNDPNGTPLDFYMDVPFSNYLNCMCIDGTFGD